jgi:hypothetical protein
MNELWLVMRYALDRAHCRAKAALGGDPESGAMTLEWIVIAFTLVGIAVAAGLLLSQSIGREAAKLP